MYVSITSFAQLFPICRNTLIRPSNCCVRFNSIAKQVIMRGHKPAGYGFVTMSSAEAAQKAVELLDSKDLDGRPVIVQIAKPAEQKDKEKKEKKAKRRPNRRGAKAVPGEVTDAEANGDVRAEDAAATDVPGPDEAAKPKKKKKKSNVCNMHSSLPAVVHATRFLSSASLTAGPVLRKVKKPMPQRVPLTMPLLLRRGNLAPGSTGSALSARTQMANPPKTCFLSQTSALA
jgi:RNA recognition motif-containing protein